MKTYEVYINGFRKKVFNCIDPVDALESWSRAYDVDFDTKDDDIVVVDLTTGEEFLVVGYGRREFLFTVTPK